MTRWRNPGRRRYRATIKKHDGTRDSAGNPTLTTSGDWDTQVSGWPCEMVTTGGGEVIRGRQVTAETTHVFFGEYFGAEGTTAKMKMTVDSQDYGIIAAIDDTGERREMRIEARREH